MFIHNRRQLMMSFFCFVLAFITIMAFPIGVCVAVESSKNKTTGWSEGSVIQYYQGVRPSTGAKRGNVPYTKAKDIYISERVITDQFVKNVTSWNSTESLISLSYNKSSTISGTGSLDIIQKMGFKTSITIGSTTSAGGSHKADPAKGREAALAIKCDYFEVTYDHVTYNVKGEETGRNTETVMIPIEGSQTYYINYSTPNTAIDYNSRSLELSGLEIDLNKTAYNVGETVIITPTAKNASSYLASVWYGDYKTGTRLYLSNTFTGSITYKPSRAGKYTVRVDANHLDGRSKGYISENKSFVVNAATSSQSGNASSAGDTVTFADGTYYIEAYCGKVVEVGDSKQTDRANVQIWSLSSRNLGCQRFNIQKDGSHYTITAVHSGKALDIADGSSASGTNIWQWHLNNTEAQRWSFEDAGDGYYYIRSALGTYMDVYDNGTGNGTNVWAYKFNGSTAQKFRLVDVSTGEIAAPQKAAHVHSLVATSAKSATCTEAGNIAYWSCNDCGKVYSDANALNEITIAQSITAALGHDFNGEFCTRCGIQNPDYVKPKSEIHLPHVTSYHQGQFSDVPADQWFTKNVAEAVELGLMKGSDTGFNPYGDVTLAEAITMASRINSIYYTGSESFDQSAGGKWYQIYLDYAYENGIISADIYAADANQKATRAQFAEIFARSLPESALSEIGNIADNAIPDVSTGAAYAPYVYQLYRAGILTGGDALGTFSPQTYITRAESATIVSRMAESDNRVSFTLK